MPGILKSSNKKSSNKKYKALLERLVGLSKDAKGILAYSTSHMFGSVCVC